MNYQKSKRRNNEPYKPGVYILDLGYARKFYSKVVRSKGKDLDESAIADILSIIVDMVMGNDKTNDLMQLYEFLNIDCIIKNQADLVIDKLKNIITDSLLVHFPDIGAYVPDDYYWVCEHTLDLYIMVPKDEEIQRGLFY